MILSAFKQRIAHALQEPTPEHFGAVPLLLAATAIVSVASLPFEFFLPHLYPTFFFVVHWTTTIIFTIEYVSRLWIVPRKGAYVMSFLGIIDLMSILPSYIGLGDFTFLKAVRIVRTFRTLRLVTLANVPSYFRRKE